VAVSRRTHAVTFACSAALLATASSSISARTWVTEVDCCVAARPTLNVSLTTVAYSSSIIGRGAPTAVGVVPARICASWPSRLVSCRAASRSGWPVSPDPSTTPCHRAAAASVRCC
jgi:hypothetical protein